MKTNKKGISLIVLVITIIIMIILASAIILSLQSSGIIGKASEAKKASDDSSAKEVVAVAKANYEFLSDAEKEAKPFSQYVGEKLVEAGFKSQGQGSYEVTDDGDVYPYPIIPAGFTASTTTGETKVSQGLVIKDAAGNEFVWVPVTDMAIFNKSTEGVKIGETTLSETNDPTGEYAEFKAVKASVQKNGGFYIARYESGKEAVDGVNKVVSKNNATVWSGIKWGDGMTSVGTTGAVALARGMYQGNSSVVSTLCYGAQWDAAVASGVGNIVNMAGGVNEWTMEEYSVDWGDNIRAFRGGSSATGTTDASFKNGNFADSTWGFGSDDYLGFRVALYIK